MPQITYQHETLIEVEAGTTILRASLDHNIPHTHACGGNARCSTCRVLILEGLEHCGPRNEKERNLAGRLNFFPTVRLACQTQVYGDVTLRRLVLDEEDQEVVALQFRDGGQGSLGTEQNLAILFADIRGFTSFAETHLPYDVIHVLNRYFNRMVPIIAGYGGQIDNFMGDGIMALFGMAGDDIHQAAMQATQAGLEMLAAVDSMKPYFNKHFGIDFSIGVGVHAGGVVLGTVGAGERRRTTAIGDAVNFASRIESANKEAQTSMLISEDAYLLVRDRIAVGKRLDLPIKGKTGTYCLYEVLGVK